MYLFVLIKMISNFEVLGLFHVTDGAPMGTKFHRAGRRTTDFHSDR